MKVNQEEFQRSVDPHAPMQESQFYRWLDEHKEQVAVHHYWITAVKDYLHDFNEPLPLQNVDKYLSRDLKHIFHYWWGLTLHPDAIASAYAVLHEGMQDKEEL